MFELRKETFYGLLFYVLAACIFCTGTVPFAREILLREVEEAESYVTVEGEITQILPGDPGEAPVLHITFPLDQGTHRGIYPVDLKEPQVGERREITYHRENPDDIVDLFYLWCQAILFLGFTLLSVFTGLLISRPVEPYLPRPRRTLRERLEHY